MKKIAYTVLNGFLSLSAYAVGMGDKPVTSGLVQTTDLRGRNNVHVWGGQANPFMTCSPIAGCPNIVVGDNSASSAFAETSKPRTPLSPHLRKQVLDLYNKGVLSTTNGESEKLGSLAFLVRDLTLQERLDGPLDLSSLPKPLQDLAQLKKQVVERGNKFIDTNAQNFTEMLHGTSKLSAFTQVRELSDLRSIIETMGMTQHTDTTYARLRTTAGQFSTRYDQLLQESLNSPAPVAAKSSPSPSS